MIQVLRGVLVYFYICFVPTIFIFPAETFRYMSTEHPSVTYYNPKYIAFANVTSQRSRSSPVYYMSAHLKTLTPVGNNVTLSFYFYEYLSNVYKRGFIEIHVKWCDLVHNDQFIGSAMRQGRFAGSCPYPAGEYHLYNMSANLEGIPGDFPFKKGRIYVNITIPATKEIWVESHVDIEFKEYNPKKHRKNGFRGLFRK